MYSEMLQGQLNLGPTGLVIEFLITVGVIAVGSWLLFKRRSSVFWKQTDYVYIFFTMVGGAAAAADIAISNWTKELQHIQRNSDELLNKLRNYLDVGVTVCNSVSAERSAERSAEQNARLNGIITPHEPSQYLPFHFESPTVPNLVPNDLNEWVQFAVLSQTECELIKRVSDAVKGNTLMTAAERTQLHKIAVDITQTSETYPIALIQSEIANLDKYVDRTEELEKTLASLTCLSLLKNMSPVLLGLGIGVRLARTHFDVKKAQEEQRRNTLAGIRSPAIATNDGGLASSEAAVISPPSDATKGDVPLD
jgi:hypothetical protein